MPPEQADNIDVVDRAPTKTDSQTDLNRSLWDELKSNAGTSAVKPENRPDQTEESATLEFSLDGLYNTIHDGLSRVVSESRTVSESNFSAGEGATGDSGRALSTDDQEFDATPSPDMQLRDVISDTPFHEMRAQDVIAEARPLDDAREAVTTEARVLEVDEASVGDGPVVEPQYRDVISAAPPADRVDPGDGDEVQHLFRQLLGEAGDGAILASAPAGGEGGGKGHRETWGKRGFLVDDDGSAQYTFKKGDTMWDVARDVLKHERPGHKPTAREIREEVDRIANGNGLKKITDIEPGETLTISPKGQRAGGGRRQAADETDDRPAAKKEKTDAADKRADVDKKSPESETRAQAGDKKPPVAEDRSEAAENRAREGGKPDDRKALESVADGIYRAILAKGTDEDTIYRLLEGRGKDEKEALNSTYKERYGITLEDQFRAKLSGAELDKALNLLDNKSGRTEDAGRIHTALVERSQWFTGRSDENCEKDIRDTVSTMNSRQIADLDRQYKEKYGVGIRDALLKDEHLSEATKQSLEIYLRGTDHRTKEDTAKLTDIALKSHNIDMFAEALRDSSPQARKAFLDNGGERRIEEAFGKPKAESGKIVYESTPALEHARDIAKTGDVSHATLIKDNVRRSGDNETAIDDEIGRFRQDERTAYKEGRELAGRENLDGITPEQKQALEFYKETREALDTAGNPAEVRRWEDMIVNGEETLVSKLAKHKGTVLDDSMHDVLSTIENMDREDYKRYVTSPEFRKEVDAVLKTYLNENELKRCNEVLAKKLDAGAHLKPDSSEKEFEKAFKWADEYGRRSVFSAIADNPPIKGAPGTNADRVLDAISNMTTVEQKLYKENAQWRETLDKQIAKALPEAEGHQAAARHMLERVKEGKQPDEDIVVKMYKQAAASDPDAGQVIRDLKTALKEDSALKDRLLNPSTDEYKALHTVLDEREYKTYAEPLIKNGRLPIEIQMGLNRGADDNEQRAYEDLLSLATDKDGKSQLERHRLVTDQEFQDKVLGFLSADERAIALNILRQGEMRPEDKLRAAMVGTGTDEEKIKEVLGGKLDKETVRAEYARKYQSDLTADLVDELGGRDEDEALRAIKPEARSAREAFNDARDEAYRSRDGLGKEWVDQTWDGTGYQTDDALNEYAKAMAEYSRKLEEMPPEQRQQLVENLTRAVDLYKRSEEAAADALVDTALIGAGIGGAAHTGGLSLKLLAFTAVAGAALKVGAKSAIQGADYDFESQGPRDALTGAADGATVLMGPEMVAQKLVEQSAATAAKNLLEKAGAELVEKGAQKSLEDGMTRILAKTFAQGSDQFDDNAIKALAKEVATDGNEEAVAAAIKKSLKETVEPESMTNSFKNALREVALNSGAGGVAGGLSGSARGFAEWDSDKTFAENMAALGEKAAGGAGLGAGAAALFTTVFKAGGAVLREGKAGDVPGEGTHPHSGDGSEPTAKERPATGDGSEPTARERPATTGDAQPAATDPGDVTVQALDSKNMRYKVGDGQPTDLFEQGGFWYAKDGSSALMDRGLKLHILTNGSGDLKDLQKVLIPALQEDPELAKLVANWKTLDPRLGDEQFAASLGKVVGEGQDAKAFTIGVKSPEDAIKIQKRIDEILAQHPELKLKEPITPQGMDKMAGSSGRVGIVRDFFTPTTDASGSVGARLDEALAEKIREKIGLRPGETPNPQDAARWQQLQANLRTVEAEAGLKSETLTFDKNGELMLEGTGSSGNHREDVRLRDGHKYEREAYYLSEAKAENLPPGEKRMVSRQVRDANDKPVPEIGADGKPVIDPDTGKPKIKYEQVEVTSEGRTDRYAYYALSEHFGVHPVDSLAESAARTPVPDLPAGTRVEINGKEYTALCNDGPDVLMIRTGAEFTPGKVIPVSEQNLGTKYFQAGDLGYYRDKQGNYYVLRDSKNGGKELIEDPMIVPVRRKELPRTAAGKSADDPEKTVTDVRVPIGSQK